MATRFGERVRLQIYVTPEVGELAERRAAHRGVSVSRLVGDLITAEFGNPSEDDTAQAVG